MSGAFVLGFGEWRSDGSVHEADETIKDGKEGKRMEERNKKGK